MNSRLTELKKQRRQELKTIRRAMPFLEGNLSLVERKCGKNSCHCVRGRRLHKTKLLTWKERKKTKTIYVPRRLEGVVKAWLNEYKALKRSVKKISILQRAILAEMKAQI